MTSPTQKKHRRIEEQLGNQTIARCVLDIERAGPTKGGSRTHLRLDFEDGGTVLITGRFVILYNDPKE